jgi:hypothetical protein
MLRLGLLGAAAALVAGCDVSVKGETDGSGNGSLSVKAPGVGLNVDLPAMVKAEISGGGDLMFPGATMSGVNVAAFSTDAAAGNGPAVELRYETPAAVREVLAWYQDPSRALALTGINVAPLAGGGYRVSGSSADGGGPVAVELSPRAGGGTQARISLQGSG